MNCRSASWLRVGMWACLGLGLALSGCKREPGPAGERTAPNPNAPALYGPPTGTASPKIVPHRVPSSADTNWQSAPFYVVQTELSPATLVHSTTKHLSLFAGLTNYGLSAPSYLAWPTMNGPRTFKRGEDLNVTNMAQCWVLVWWAGAEGWTNWDSPWVVYLQHQPASMKLDEDGLHFEFARAAGDVVMMPLYGYDKPPQQGHDFRAQHGLPASKVPVKTWEWPKVVTRDPLTRIRYWASALREFPVYCEDTFSVDCAKDSVTIRSRFQWRSIHDDWKTPHLKLAPLSPPLAHAAKIGGFPVEFSKPWFDLNQSTPYGPYLAVEGADEFDATFPVLQYVNETEAFVPPATNAPPGVLVALEKLRQLAAQRFASAGRNAGGLPASGPTAFAEAAWVARALPYLDAVMRSNAVDRLGAILRDGLRRAERSPSAAAEAADSDEGLIEALWAYAHFSGDWTLVRERWPVIKRLFLAPARSRWAGFGSEGATSAEGCASSAIALARLGYQAGDLEWYQYACGIAARELVLSFVKMRGADYFRKHQPWHSLEVMDAETFLTNLRRDGAGWRIDGPKYPAQTTDRQFARRWQRFRDLDVARFFRDYLADDVRRELNWLQYQSQQGSNWWRAPGDSPSFVQLRSLLLNASPTNLASMDASNQLGWSGSDPIANCLSILRVSHSTRFERLIAPGPPSAFSVGLERDVAGPNSQLLVSVSTEKAGANPVSSASVPDWPQLQWREWTTPTGAAWTFGHIRPVRQGAPAKVEFIPLNWNTRVLRFEMP